MCLRDKITLAYRLNPSRGFCAATTANLLKIPYSWPFTHSNEIRGWRDSKALIEFTWWTSESLSFFLSHPLVYSLHRFARSFHQRSPNRFRTMAQARNSRYSMARCTRGLCDTIADRRVLFVFWYQLMNRNICATDLTRLRPVAPLISVIVQGKKLINWSKI